MKRDKRQIGRDEREKVEKRERKRGGRLRKNVKMENQRAFWKKRGENK